MNWMRSDTVVVLLKRNTNMRRGKHDDSQVNQYTQKIISTSGKHDGLAWQNADGTWGGPLRENVAKAVAEGYSDKTQPYHGYFFKVLNGQGLAAPLGQMDFVVRGVMIGGFALAQRRPDTGSRA